MIAIKRVYDPPARADGVRILVDRLWPRGLAKRDAKLDRWMREIAPSTELRKFFGHDPAHWKEFRTRYLAELKREEARRLLDEIAGLAKKGAVTLIYGASDREHNQAVVLKELLDRKFR